MISVYALLLSCGEALIISVFLVPREKSPAESKEPAMALWLRTAGLHGLSLTRFNMYRALAAMLLGLFVAASTGLWNFALLSAATVYIAPRMWLRQRARARTEKTLHAWPDAVDHLRSAIRAGLALPEALAQLAERGPQVLRPGFESFARDYRASGSFSLSIERLKDYLSDPVADTIIESLKIAREVGGTDLGRLLGSLSEFLRDNARTRSELKARQSWTINAARLACFAPWFVLFLMALQPATRTVYNSFAGACVMAAGAGISVVAYRMMLRIGQLPEQKRVFA